MNVKRNKDITEEQLLAIILQKYGTITDFAKAFGITRQNATNKIKTRSYPFVAELKRKGVFDNLDNKGIATNKQTGNNYIGDIQELRNENEQLKQVIKNLNDLIDSLKLQLGQKIKP